MYLVIFGEGGLGHEILDMVQQIQEAGTKSYDEIVFADDTDYKTGYCGHRTMPSEEVFKRYLPSNTKFVIAVGEPSSRAKVIKRIKEKGYNFETLIHPTAYVGLNSKIGEGTIIQRDVFVSCDCNIGENCLLQPSANIGHNTCIEENCVISTNCAISGGVYIGRETYIAVGVSVIQGANIGNNTVIGMGSVVLRDVPDNVVALGNPARPMKNKDEGKVFK